MDLMLDLESMSVKKNAAIIQIGAIQFDPLKIDSNLERSLGGFQINVNLQSAIICGGDYDPDTAKWWKTQSTPAQESICGLAHDIGAALQQFSSWCKNVPFDCIWANGAGDDIAWLGSAYERLNMQVPWRFNRVRDTRTLFDLASRFGWERPSSGGITEHTALADAIAQAKDVQSANWFFSNNFIRDMNMELDPSGIAPTAPRVEGSIPSVPAPNHP